METNHHRLRYPGFPVEVGGVVELHAALLTESRTRGRVSSESWHVQQEINLPGQESEAP